MTKQHNLPIQEPTFYVLLSLAQENKHGYAILKDVAVLSGGKVRLSTGTLYGALSRMLDQGWILRLDDGDPGESEERSPGKPRKTYTLTGTGRLALEDETRRLSHLVAAARQRLAEEPI